MKTKMKMIPAERSRHPAMFGPFLSGCDVPHNRTWFPSLTPRKRSRVISSARRILGLHVEIGGRRVFDPDRLQNVFSDAARGTVAEGAQLVIKVLPVRHHCRNCGHEFHAPGVERPCPDCSCPHTEMTGGEELRLLDMQLDDAA